ncbi:hypothetical protein HY621_04250 [Candidatus Uhrbacteria bacterium]|nr:hypothetical protein [Candidatus Uhrbacteria bacterium]
MIHISNKKGASVLIAILIMSGALVLIALASISQSIGELDLSYSSSKGNEALWLAEGCSQETLRRIRMNQSYGIGAGVITLTTSSGSCTIQITDLGSGNRRILSMATAATATKQIQVEFSLNGSVITITSWMEI